LSDKEDGSLIDKTLKVIEVFGIISIFSVAWLTHKDSQIQIDRMEKITSKYEKQLDKLISEDKDIGKRYINNLRKAMEGLSPKEREILLSIYDSK